ncbi:thioredoxin family protein [Raineyella sp.]|uniref:thioredoxin family protein n=1 Tax=Raineyella sp. TaxID=1911550 RepID=UPI002B209A78|nr:thioredoxin domain-containing protein [Raineyella sp.]MEA5153249.1 thioredoxin domain-containing protein [Raineyella sp.]
MENQPLDAVTDATFADSVLSAAVPVVVHHSAAWCSPCRQLDPILQELATRFRDRVRFVRLDTDANPVTPAEQGVHGVPTVQIFVGGREVRRFQGARTKMELQDAVESVLA